jgi:16S rRNA (uracil1498-N3)-methyltransferase
LASEASMRRPSWKLDTYIVPAGSLAGASVRLDGPEHRHAFSAARARVGDTVRLIDGEGVEALARVDSAVRSGASLAILETVAHRREDGTSLTVVQGLPKGRGFDEVVRRCAELGVATVVPVETERTVSRPKESAGRERLDRWRAVSVAAAKQSRAVFLTEVSPVTTLDDAAGLIAGCDAAFVAWEEGGTPLADALREAGSPRRLLAVVGPEGGLTASEVDALRQRGAVTVALGARILKADWAAAAMAAMISSALGGLLP